MPKTVAEIIAALKADRSQATRLAFWESTQLLIDKAYYSTALARVTDNRHDHDFATQLRCVSESIAQHVEKHGNMFQVKD